MKWRFPILIFAGLCWSAWGFLYRTFPMPGEIVILHGTGFGETVPRLEAGRR